jgi:hypothetical protein
VTAEPVTGEVADGRPPPLWLPACGDRVPGMRVDLVVRLPTLAVPPEEVPPRTHATVDGVHRLPVTW